MHLAAEKGYTRVIQLLLDADASINARNNLGETPLMIAAENGHDDTVRFLIERGADVNAQDTLGKTALMHVPTKLVPEIIDTKTPLVKKT